MPSKDNDAPGIKGNRSRTKRGPLRKKRERRHPGRHDEKEYGRDFGVRRATWSSAPCCVAKARIR